MVDRGFFIVAGVFIFFGLLLATWGACWFYDVARFIQHAEKISVRVFRIERVSDQYGGVRHIDYTFIDPLEHRHFARVTDSGDWPQREGEALVIYEARPDDPSRPLRVLPDDWNALWLSPILLMGFGALVCLPCTAGLVGGLFRRKPPKKKAEASE